MANSHAHPSRRALDRRGFLKRLGASAASVVSAPVLARASERRVVSFVHTHTGETLSAAYFDHGCYQAGCMAEVDRLLRDFRTGDVHPIDPSLLDILFELQRGAGRDGPFEIISGYRSPGTNALLRSRSEGVAQHSMHMEGRAIDVRLAGISSRKLGEIARSLSRGGVGIYPASDFVHVDTGRVRFW